MTTSLIVWCLDIFNLYVGIYGLGYSWWSGNGGVVRSRRGSAAGGRGMKGSGGMVFHHEGWVWGGGEILIKTYPGTEPPFPSLRPTRTPGSLTATLSLHPPILLCSPAEQRAASGSQSPQSFILIVHVSNIHPFHYFI